MRVPRNGIIGGREPCDSLSAERCANLGMRSLVRVAGADVRAIVALGFLDLTRDVAAADAHGW